MITNRGNIWWGGGGGIRYEIERTIEFTKESILVENAFKVRPDYQYDLHVLQ